MTNWKGFGSIYGSEQGPEAGSCEHHNEPSDSIHGGEILDQWNNYQVYK